GIHVYSSQVFLGNRRVDRRFRITQTHRARRRSCRCAISRASFVERISSGRHAERIEPALENSWWRERVSSRGGACKTRVRARNAGELLGLQRTNAWSNTGSSGRRSSAHFGNEPSSGTDLSSLARIHFAEWN